MHIKTLLICRALSKSVKSRLSLNGENPGERSKIDPRDDIEIFTWTESPVFSEYSGKKKSNWFGYRKFVNFNDKNVMSLSKIAFFFKSPCGKIFSLWSETSSKLRHFSIEISLIFRVDPCCVWYEWKAQRPLIPNMVMRTMTLSFESMNIHDKDRGLRAKFPRNA